MARGTRRGGRRSFIVVMGFHIHLQHQVTTVGMGVGVVWRSGGNDCVGCWFMWQCQQASMSRVTAPMLSTTLWTIGRTCVEIDGNPVSIDYNFSRKS